MDIVSGPPIGIVTPSVSTPTQLCPSVANATSVTLLASNTARKYLLIQNNSGVNVALSLKGATLTGIVPTVTNQCIVLSPGMWYESNSAYCSSSAITVYQTSGASINTVTVVEG